MSATAAPLTPTLSPEYRGEGAIAASAARDQLFTQLARGVRGTARSQAMHWARWEESVSLLSAENESLVSDAELQLLDDLFAKY